MVKLFLLKDLVKLNFCLSWSFDTPRKNLNM
jgi:hypothetical protein